MAVIILESFQTRQDERPNTTYKRVLAHERKGNISTIMYVHCSLVNRISSALLSGNYSSFEEEVPVVLGWSKGGIWGWGSVDQSHCWSLIKLALSSVAWSAISL